MRSATQNRLIAAALTAAILVSPGSLLVSAQIEMPTPKRMSGIPLPSTDLPDGTVSVRLIRDQLSQNIARHPVELRIDRRVRTARTDENGRAQFAGVPPQASVRARAQIAGEQVESQVFQMPPTGGIRLMLVASGARQGDETIQAGEMTQGKEQAIVIGDNSRFVVELTEGAIQFFELIELVNPASQPVSLSAPLLFKIPEGARGTTLLEGTTELASVAGQSVQVAGPVPPGRTLVQIATEIPYSGDSIKFRQKMPISLESVTLVVEKEADMRLRSDRINTTQEVTAKGTSYIMAQGGPMPSGTELDVELSGLPHQSRWPIYLAGALAVLVLGWGMWSAVGPSARAAARSAENLVSTRERLFGELVALERDYGAGRLERPQYHETREALIQQLYEASSALGGGTAA